MSLYELPPEPVGSVWDKDGTEWWQNQSSRLWTNDSIIYSTWARVLTDVGPLTDVPPAPSVGDTVTLEQFADLPYGSVAVTRDNTALIVNYSGVYETGFHSRVTTDGPISSLPLTLLRLGRGDEA